MNSPVYKQQVRLLLQVIPYVTQEACFALHGGTAINLFVRDMPRMSVDIDLTYIPLEDRQTSLAHIASALERIKASVEDNLPNTRVVHKQETGKLQIAARHAVIKLEVNLVGRGLLGASAMHPLCPKAQTMFEDFCETRLVPIGQLYGGKLCAALDRQHPRDLFDVKYLLEHEGITDEIKTGFLYGLISSDRPLNELLAPNLLDQQALFNKQFLGMNQEPFTYKAFEETRSELIETLHKRLSEQDKKFLLGIVTGELDWSIYDFKDFPSVQWKLLNLGKLRKRNPDKYAEQVRLLEESL